LITDFCPKSRGIHFKFKNKLATLLNFFFLKGKRRVKMAKYMLKPLKEQTQSAPLCALGDFLTQNKVLQPLQEVHIPPKTVRHSPTDKLLDSLTGIMSGCSALSHINWQVRPDQALQSAFSRKPCADQSTISDTLNSFSLETVEQLRAAEAIYSQHGQALPNINKSYSRSFIPGMLNARRQFSKWRGC
jgi:hypothetical protein